MSRLHAACATNISASSQRSARLAAGPEMASPTTSSARTRRTFCISKPGVSLRLHSFSHLVVCDVLGVSESSAVRMEDHVAMCDYFSALVAAVRVLTEKDAACN